MTEPQLKEVLLDAAHAAFKHQTLIDSPNFRDALFQEFLLRWHFSSDDLKLGHASAASGAYLFLFHKNLSVTNISLTELVSLLRFHARSRKSDKSMQVNFFSEVEYRHFFVNLWESFFVAEKEDADGDFPLDAVNSTINNIVTFHSYVFESTIILDAYFTSAIIHIPRSIKIDVRAVTFQSGYIHSSGPMLYVKQIEKSAKYSVTHALKRFLDKNEGTKFFVTPYASEYFEPYEDDSAASVRNGLDGVRLQLRKHFIEEETLVSFLETLRVTYPQVIVPRGEFNYSRERDFSCDAGATKEATIWFITDTGFVFGSEVHPSIKNRDIFLIVYAQLYLNYSQPCLFKERKPAWIASTTLPHTLSAAMINISRSYVKAEEHENYPILLDPFCGTGTTLIDSLLRFPKSIVIGLDRNPLMPSMVRENFRFLTRDRYAIASMRRLLKAIRDQVGTDLSDRHVDSSSMIARALRGIEVTSDLNQSERVPEDDFAYCVRLLIEELRQITVASSEAVVSDLTVSELSRRGFSGSLINKLSGPKFPYEVKTVFYLLWRALLMNTFSIRAEVRSPRALYEVIQAELEKSLKEYGDLDKLLDRQIKSKHGAFDERIGKYSHECATSIDYLREIEAHQFTDVREGDLGIDYIAQQQKRVAISHVRDSLKALGSFVRSADIIVTDPPYGFNYDEGDSLQTFYADLIPVLLKTLKHRGQLIMALPAFARNGKQIPFYQTRGSIVRQIISCAETSGRRLVRYADTLPGMKEVFQPPWYWGSDSTVERRIVHFIVEDE
jgi:Putative RNA methylase family UPF0020